MNQKIVCQKGTCIEDGTFETEFDTLFESTNIVEQIQKDLTKNILK